MCVVVPVLPAMILPSCQDNLCLVAFVGMWWWGVGYFLTKEQESPDPAWLAAAHKETVCHKVGWCLLSACLATSPHFYSGSHTHTHLQVHVHTDAHVHTHILIHAQTQDSLGLHWLALFCKCDLIGSDWAWKHFRFIRFFNVCLFVFVYLFSFVSVVCDCYVLCSQVFTSDG